MNLSRKLLRANIILILISVAAHEVAAKSFVFLGLTLLICIAKCLTERQESPLRLEPAMADTLCAIAFAIMFIRSFSTSVMAGVRMPDIRVSIMGQFLIILQWVYLFRRKRPRDYAWIYLVSVVHMGSAGLMMPGVGYGVFFVLYVASGVSALYVFNAWHMQQRAQGTSSRPVLAVNPRFFMLALVSCAAILLPLVAVFMTLPRRRALLRINAPLGQLSAQPMTGFSHEVRLGTLGRIQANPARVMHLTVHDAETNDSLRPQSLLLKGVALDAYDRARQGNWVWSQSEQGMSSARTPSFSGELEITPAYRTNFPGFNSGSYNRIRCDITLEPLYTSYLFAPFAPESINGPHYRRIFFHPLTHVLRYAPRRRGQLSYSVVSRIFALQPSSESPPPPSRKPGFLDMFLQLPDDLSPRIRELARELTPDDEYPDDYAKAMRLLAYLSDERRFSYTLNMPPTRGVEPVENFLFNAREGHCEYFASAMALMLREIGIPSRVVNGFKVSEWNPLGGHYNVRQSDAHSWVEAYLRPYGWRTLDPGVMRETAIPKPRFAMRWWRNVHDTAETLWVRHVLNYDNDAQTRFTRIMIPVSRSVITPLRRLSRRLFTHGTRLKTWSQLVLTLALALALFFAWRRLSLWIRTNLVGRRRLEGMFKYYRRMERLLAKRGFKRRVWQTPWEFSDTITEAACPGSAAVETVTRAFCAMRYGGRKVSPEETRQVEAALEDLKELLGMR